MIWGDRLFREEEVEEVTVARKNFLGRRRIPNRTPSPKTTESSAESVAERFLVWFSRLSIVSLFLFAGLRVVSRKVFSSYAEVSFLPAEEVVEVVVVETPWESEY